MLELFIVRHGESIRNHACLLAHHGDVDLLERQLREEPEEATWPLTEAGHVQAATAGEWLAKNAANVAAAYCSPFERTLETAHFLHLSIPIETDVRLREREWGDYPTGVYGPAEYLDDIRQCAQFEWKSIFPGSESLKDLVPTSEAFITELRRKHSSGSVVLITHGGRMAAIEHVIEGAQPERRFTNCCILHYKIDGEEGTGRVVYPAQPELLATEWTPFRAASALSASQ